jgi:serine/threonine protein kinase
LLQWSQQAAEALQFIHANGVCHGDVSCTNFFLDKSLDLKVGDFTSLSNGSRVTMQDIQDDISDYGSALYEMATGYPPFPDLHKNEREQRLKQKSFPDLANLELKSVVLRCWNGHYKSFADVLRDVNIARKQS